MNIYIKIRWVKKRFYISPELRKTFAPHLFLNAILFIIIYSLEFFTSALADGLSLEFEWHQVSSSHQDSSQYSGRSQKCISLDSLHLSANFQVLQSL